MKPIANQAHHDGLGLADTMTIYADARDPNAGNASHSYLVTVPAPPPARPRGHVVLPLGPVVEGERVALVHFQRGPRNEAESEPGILDGVLIAILLDRLEGFQSGPYKCRENALVITKLEEALHWLQHRARVRAARGVLGTNTP